MKIDCFSLRLGVAAVLLCLAPSAWAQKVSALPNVTTLASNALFSVSTNTGGSYATRNIAFGSVSNQLAEAWNAAATNAIYSPTFTNSTLAANNRDIPLVNNYVLRMGLGTIASNRIYSWAKTLNDAGIFNNLVDCALLRSNLNSASKAATQTFSRSNSPALGDSANMIYDSRGLWLPGSATMTALWTNVPDTRINTLVCEARVWIRDGTTYAGSPWFEYYGGTDNQNSIRFDLNGGLLGVAEWLGANHPYVMYNRAAGAASLPAKGETRTYFAGLTPGVGLYCSIDGVNAKSDQSTDLMGVAGSTFIRGLTNILVGTASATLNVPIMIQSWALFDKVLSYSERLAALDAWRYLDGTDENQIAYGDSRIWPGGYSAGGSKELGWFGKLAWGSGEAVSNTYGYGSFSTSKFYDGSRPGSFVSNLVENLYFTNILQWAPRGAVKKSTVWMLSDWNDANAGYPATVIWNNYSNAVNLLKDKGFTVKAVIPPLGNTMDAICAPLHDLIRTNATMFDEVVEQKTVSSQADFSVGVPNFWSVDTLHYSTNANRVFADWIGSRQTRQTRHVTHPGSVTSPGWLTLSNTVATWPVTPPTAGAAFIGNSNGTVYLLTSGLGTTWTGTNKLAP